MINHSVLVTGVTKNTANYILKTLNNMLSIARKFRKAHIIIYENDSKDRTLKILKQFQSKHSKIMTVLTEKNVRHMSRTKRIAYARNKVLDHITEHYQNFEFVINMDTDDVGNRKIHNLEPCFEPKNLKKWDMLGAVTPRYYDIWALRTKELNYNCHDAVRHAEQRGVPHHIADRMYVKQLQTDYRPLNSLIRVLSCFNGFAIYKMEKIKDCRYNGEHIKCKRHSNRTPCMANDCEHVAFHRDMRDKHDAKLFINTHLQLLHT